MNTDADADAESPDPEFHVARGHRRLNEGQIDLAISDLFDAIDIAPDHGIALGLAAIAAARAGDPALQQRVIERYCSASKQQLLDLGEVAKWYAASHATGSEPGPQVAENRAAFRSFGRRLVPLLQHDSQRLGWLGEGLEPVVTLGHQGLNEGQVDLAVEDLLTAIDLLPHHGIALGLASIAAMRADDVALQQCVIERYCSASRQLLLDLGEVGKWYVTPCGSQPSRQVENNRAAFRSFVGKLVPLLEHDSPRLDWLGQGLEPLVTLGHKGLNEGQINLAVENLSTAIDLLPHHGVALGLAAIAAIRADDLALRQRVTERYCSAARPLLLDLGEVGRWYSRPYEPGSEPDPQAEKNRVAFDSFVGTLVDLLESHEKQLFWLGEGLYAALHANFSSDVFARYCGTYPGNRDAEGMLIEAVMLTCDFASSERSWHEQLALVHRQLDADEPISIDPYNLLLAGVDFRLFSRVCRRRSTDFMPADHAPTGHRNVSRSDDRIRLGFVLPYSWFASCNVCLDALLPEFDRRRFQIHGYALHTAKEPDDFECRYRTRFDQFVPLDRLSPDAAARRIAADNIDVAIDLSGHPRTTCLPILAYRPAPIQAHLIGWGTLIEAPYIDYLITDPHYHPKHLRDMTTETFALMPEGSWVYPPVELADRGQARSRGGNPFRFCSFNFLGKIDRQTFEAWMEILRRTEDSVMVLCHWNLGDAVRNMRSAAERAGIDPARLVFLPRVNHVEHLTRLRSMDLALDPLRLGGGASTMDALWTGLPIVSACTHESYLHASRGAFGSLSMSEEIVSDVSSYVGRAVELRNDPGKLNALREKIVARREGVLMFDPPRYAAELQRLIQEIWTRYVRGDQPATFTLGAAHLDLRKESQT